MNMKPKKIISKIDYVVFYAEQLKENAALFKQHKEFIESQYAASRSLFSNMFSKDNFKAEARQYLRKIALLR